MIWLTMKTIRALETLLLSFPKVSERIVPGNSGTVVPLAVIHNSFFTSLVSVILKNICILHQDEELKQAFIYGPFVFFCVA